MGGGGGGGSEKLKKAMRKLFVQPWNSVCRRDQRNIVVDNSDTVSPVCSDSPNFFSLENQTSDVYCKEITVQGVQDSSHSDKNLCAICLDPLNYSSGGTARQPIFTAQCSHAFHFSCISSNIRHGSLTCPICRAHWTQFPHTRCLLHNKPDPNNLQVHRNTLWHSASYYNDGSIVPDRPGNQSHLYLSLYLNSNSCSHHASLRVKLSHQPVIDLVLVATPTGPHLTLMKQAMALTVFSLRSKDRLAIITYSSGTTRAFPLMHMTSSNKRTALQIIGHLLPEQVDPTDGLTKGVKILEDRLHKNPNSGILHLTDASSRPSPEVPIPIPIHRFQIKCRFNAYRSLFMYEFNQFLAGTLGGVVDDVQLRIGEGGMVVCIGEVRGGEDRYVPVCVGESGRVRVAYRYRDGEIIRRGEVIVGID